MGYHAACASFLLIIEGLVVAQLSKGLFFRAKDFGDTDASQPWQTFPCQIL